MARICFFILIFLSVSIAGFSQFKQPYTAANIVEHPQKPPQFPGGIKAWDKYISENLRIPEVLKAYKFSTVIYTEVVVTKSGLVDWWNPGVF